MAMEHQVYHGCGHYWLIFTMHFDARDRVIEGWQYSRPMRTGPMRTGELTASAIQIWTLSTSTP